MGCDIHGFLETKEPNGEWESRNGIPDDRDYD